MEFLFEIAKQYGLFVALVAWVIWDSREREKANRARDDAKDKERQAREKEHRAESKAREDKYIEREEKYISVIQELTVSVEGIQQEIVSINGKIGRSESNV